MRNDDIGNTQLTSEMVYPREVLNKLKWAKGEELSDAIVWYVHRGAPGDVLAIAGSKIRNLGKGFFETDEATIPYHRIIRIEYKGRTIFEKKMKAVPRA